MLQKTLKEEGIDDSKLTLMVDHALKGREAIKGFKTLTREDIFNIYKKCL